jgi:type VI protein secretion system component VasK
MIRVVLYRILLAALPLLFYWVWRQIALRRGKVMGATPWGWLIGLGGVLAGLSLMATVAFHPDNRGQVYVPAEPEATGAVGAAHFDAKKAPPPKAAP